MFLPRQTLHQFTWINYNNQKQSDFNLICKYNIKLLVNMIVNFNYLTINFKNSLNLRNVKGSRHDFTPSKFLVYDGREIQ